MMPLKRDMKDVDEVINNIDRVRCLDFFTTIRQCYCELINEFILFADITTVAC